MGGSSTVTMSAWSTLCGSPNIDRLMSDRVERCRLIYIFWVAYSSPLQSVAFPALCGLYGCTM